MAVWSQPRAEVEARGGRFGWSAPLFATQHQSYADVDGSRVDTALQSVAVGSAVDLIASLGSELPVDVFRGRGTSKQQLPVPGHLLDPGADGYGLQDWSYRVLTSWLLRGNLYGDVLDRRQTQLLAVELFDPDCVTGMMEGGAPVWFVNGQKFEGGEFLHKRVFPLPGQILGRSPIAYHASTVGVSLASTGFGWQWYRDGAHPSAILRNTDMSRKVDGGLARKVKDAFMGALRGTREPVVMDQGWEYERVQMSPEESQFLETMGYTEAQCARIYGPGIAEVLGYAVKGASLTYSNIQDRGLHLLTYSINKWLRRLERLLSEFLPRPQYAVINRDALLATNTMQRYLAHASALGARWKVVNEVREIEDLPPVPWGNEPNSGGAPPPEPAPEPDAEQEDQDEEEEG